MSAQALVALSKANEIRSARAALKVRIAKGEIDREGVCELLREPPPELHSMRVAALLMALPHFGSTKVQTILRRASLGPATTIRSCHNIEGLVKHLTAWPSRVQ